LLRYNRKLDWEVSTFSDNKWRETKTVTTGEALFLPARTASSLSPDSEGPDKDNFRVCSYRDSMNCVAMSLNGSGV